MFGLTRRPSTSTFNPIHGPKARALLVQAPAGAGRTRGLLNPPAQPRPSPQRDPRSSSVQSTTDRVVCCGRSLASFESVSPLTAPLPQRVPSRPRAPAAMSSSQSPEPSTPGTPSPVLSVRIVSLDYYMAPPVPGFGFSRSPFHGALPFSSLTAPTVPLLHPPFHCPPLNFTRCHAGDGVEEVPVVRIYGSTPAGQKTCLHIHRVRCIPPSFFSSSLPTFCLCLCTFVFGPRAFRCSSSIAEHV